MGTPSSAGAATPTSTTSAATDNTAGTNSGNKSPKKEEQQQQNNSVWSEHVNAEGKKYYYNRLTKKSVWDKPEELKSKEEVRIWVFIMIELYTDIYCAVAFYFWIRYKLFCFFKFSQIAYEEVTIVTTYIYVSPY